MDVLDAAVALFRQQLQLYQPYQFEFENGTFEITCRDTTMISGHFYLKWLRIRKHRDWTIHTFEYGNKHYPEDAIAYIYNCLGKPG